MPLKRTVKSVLLHKGMADDADRFLAEPPAVDYAENLRIDKAGSLQKRPGFGPDLLATVPNTDGSSPFLIHGVGDTLTTLTDDGAKSFDGLEWSGASILGFVGTRSEALSTRDAIGLGECSYQPLLDVNGDVLGYAVGYEIREQPSVEESPTDVDRSVVLQWYGADGKFREQLLIDDASSLRLVAGIALPGERFVGAFYIRKSTQQLQYRKLTLPDGFGSEVQVGVSVLTRPTGYQWDSGTSSLPEECPRLGQGVWGQGRYQVTFHPGSGYFFLMNSEIATIDLYRIDTDGVKVGSELALTTIRGDVLDISVAGDDVLCAYHVWQRASGPPYFYEVRVERVSTATFLPVETAKSFGQNSEDNAFVITHGSVVGSIDVDGTSKFMVAYHVSGYAAASQFQDPSSQDSAEYSHPYNVRWPYGGVYYEEFDYSGGISVSQGTGRAYSHRLTTTLAYFDGGFYGGLQQWIDHTPHVDNIGSVNQYVGTLPCVKPVTTSVCLLSVADGADTAHPVASLDAGNSGHADYPESEAAVSLLPLVADSNGMWAGNRVKLGAESVTCYLGSRNNVWKRASNIETWSRSLLRVHRIDKGVQRPPVSSLGDGLVIGSALPLWFDGRDLGEFSPLESPEIIRVEDDKFSDDNNVRLEQGNPGAVPPEFGGVNYPLPQMHESTADSGGDDGWDSSKWRIFRAVTGYSDSSGNIHRSAPSASAYVFELFEENQDTSGNDYVGENVTFFVTTPLSAITSGVQYFVEIYGSKGPDDTPVLVAHAPLERTSTITPGVVEVRLNRDAPDTGYKVKPISRTTAGVYTDGGYLAADPWPSFDLSVGTSTRFWAIDANNPGRVLPSKLFEDYVSPEYNPSIAINLGDERNLTAIGKLDDKVVIFEPNDIHVIYGDGPDNRGQGQDFAVHYISTDVGCDDQESVIECPSGLIFYSKPRGFYLLDRNLQVQFIGGGCEDVARDIDILSATLVRDKAEVRFAFTGGPTEHLGPDPDTTAVERPPRPEFTNVPPTGEACALTYNYEHNTWLLYTNYDAQAATIYQGKYTMLRSDWSIWQESEDRWDDPSGTNATKLITPWIRLSEQVQGFNRLWQMRFLGRYLSSLQDLGTDEFEASNIRVRIYYDYEAEHSEEYTKKFQDLGFNPFDADPKRPERLQFTVEPGRGRCQAVKLEIDEVLPVHDGEGLTYKIGRGFEISSIDFEMGIAPSRALLSEGFKV